MYLEARAVCVRGSGCSSLCAVRVAVVALLFFNDLDAWVNSSQRQVNLAACAVWLIVRPFLRGAAVWTPMPEYLPFDLRPNEHSYDGLRFGILEALSSSFGV